MKKRSISSVIKEKCKQTTVVYHFTIIKLVELKKSDKCYENLGKTGPSALPVGRLVPPFQNSI